MYLRKVLPMPGNYVTGNKEFADLFIDYSRDGDIHDKKYLKHFRGTKFFPETFFELVKSLRTNPGDLFF